MEREREIEAQGGLREREIDGEGGLKEREGEEGRK